MITTKWKINTNGEDLKYDHNFIILSFIISSMQSTYTCWTVIFELSSLRHQHWVFGWSLLLYHVL